MKARRIIVTSVLVVSGTALLLLTHLRSVPVRQVAVAAAGAAGGDASTQTSSGTDVTSSHDDGGSGSGERDGGGGDGEWDGGEDPEHDGVAPAPEEAPTVAPTTPAPPPPDPPAPKASSGPSVPSSSGTCDLRSGPATYHGTSDVRNLLLVPSAQSRIAYPCPYPEDWRGIRVSPTSIRLVEGGQFLRQIPFSGGGTIGLDDITEAIDDPDWLHEIAPGIFELRATLVQTEGTVLDVRSPRVSELRLVDRPGVALAGTHATATFDGVVVTSWNETTGGPDTSIAEERPYVTYQNGSRLDIVRSNFRYLGSDRTSSYGVSWRNRGTTGTVADSIFEHNFIGIYTYEAANMHIERNIVRNNVVYGIDPHDYSTGLVITDNDVYANGSHGIIFSRFVNDSVVVDNFSHENVGNGIMMDFHSDQNLIDGNIVRDNAGEGIVVSASADVTIRSNRVSGSEVGVRLSHAGSDRVVVERNTISGVETGVKIYDMTISPTVQGNTVSRASVAGARVDAPGATFAENRFTSVPVGYDARAAMTITGGKVVAEERALAVAAGAIVTLSGADFVSRDVGIRVAPTGEVVRRHTEVAVRDDDEGTAGRTLSFLGLVLVLAALVLQTVHAVRNRRWARHAPAPMHVRNLS